MEVEKDSYNFNFSNELELYVYSEASWQPIPVMLTTDNPDHSYKGGLDCRNGIFDHFLFFSYRWIRGIIYTLKHGRKNDNYE